MSVRTREREGVREMAVSVYLRKAVSVYRPVNTKTQINKEQKKLAPIRNKTEKTMAI